MILQFLVWNCGKNASVSAMEELNFFSIIGR